MLTKIMFLMENYTKAKMYNLEPETSPRFVKSIAYVQKDSKTW